MTSHIVFDSSYVSDTWDWFESILIVMDQELWYDPTLGHSHLREFYYRMTIMPRHTLLSRWQIFEPCPFPGGYQMSFSSHWSMRHDWRVSSDVLYTGAYPFRSMMVFRHSCSLEAIRFISHWSARYDWVISLMLSQEHNLLIIIDIFFRWLDQDTGTYESMRRSLVISGLPYTGA